MVRIVSRFAIGLETYVVTLNACPNVDILANYEKTTTYLLIKGKSVLTSVDTLCSEPSSQVLKSLGLGFSSLAELDRSLAAYLVYFVFVSITVLQFLLQFLLRADASSP